ncbi:hypothetical protein, partial [Klebsiella pneumoniae]|uniref:hypothetical protein n=1 Tax=Klebsiella pneumoniae TaxID=573 RepID=UPI0040556B4A
TNSWEKQVDKRKEKYLSENDSDKKSKSSFDRKHDRLHESFRSKEERKTRLSPTKSSETISSLISTTSGEDKTKGTKKDKVFSDT